MDANWNKQKKWVWIAKGIGILLVILGHFGPSGWWPNLYDRMITGVYLFHMPLFVFLSGYLFRQDTGYIGIREYGNHFFKICLRIGLPFISVNLLYVAMKQCGQIFFPYGSMKMPDLWRSFIFPFTDAPCNLSWFLYVLFFFMLMYPLFLAVFRKKYLLVLLAIGLYFLPGSPFLAYDRLCRFFVFFCLGNWFRDFPLESFLRRGTRWCYYFMVFFAVFCLVVVFVISFLTSQTVLSRTVLALIGSITGVISIVLWSLFRERGCSVFDRFFAWIGRYSLSIYLFLQPFVWFFPVLLHKFGFSHTGLFWGCIPSIVAGIVFPILLERHFLSKVAFFRLMFLGGRK